MGLGFDDGQRCERPAAEFLAEMGGAFEQAGVDVEDVAGKGFASWWPTEQKGKLGRSSSDATSNVFEQIGQRPRII